MRTVVSTCAALCAALLASAAVADTPRLVRDIYPGAYGSSIISGLTFGGRLYFPATASLPSAPSVGYTNLWSTDRTSTGTALFFEPRPGSSSSIGELVRAGSLFFFFTGDGTLWKSDGTSGGTSALKKFSQPERLVAQGSHVFFFASSSGVTGLWVSDGTAAGTVEVAANQFGGELVTMGGRVYFVGMDSAHGAELWSADATVGSAALVADIAPGTQGSVPKWLTAQGSTLYFLTYGGPSANGGGLWRSDGTSSGTTLVKSLYPSVPAGGVFAEDLAVSQGKLFFRAVSSSAGEEVWVSDGTEAGTVMLADIDPGTANSIPLFFRGFADLGTVTVFAAKSAFTAQDQLWRTDGTSGGTTPIGGWLPDKFWSNGRVAYFASQDQLWTTDGTASGTKFLVDLNPTTGMFPRPLGELDGQLLFSASDGVHGEELWTLDPPGYDAGMPVEPDSGVDAGVPLDAAVDASEPVLDAGSVDAAMVDAAEAIPDAAEEVTSAKEQKGCGCGSAGGSVGFPALALGLAIQAVRRRRSSAR